MQQSLYINHSCDTNVWCLWCIVLSFIFICWLFTIMYRYWKGLSVWCHAVTCHACHYLSRRRVAARHAAMAVTSPQLSPAPPALLHPSFFLQVQYISTVQMYRTGYHCTVQIYRTGYHSTVQMYRTSMPDTPVQSVQDSTGVQNWLILKVIHSTV